MAIQTTIYDAGIQEPRISPALALQAAQEKLQKVHKCQQGLFKRLAELQQDCVAAEQVIEDIIHSELYGQ